MWGGGGVSCKSYFNSLIPFDMQSFPFFKAVWKSSVPKKIQFFSWLLVHDTVLTYDRIHNRFPDFSLSPNHRLRRSNSETLNHIFLNSPFISCLWNRVSQELNMNWVMRQSIKECYLQTRAIQAILKSLCLEDCGPYSSLV